MNQKVRHDLSSPCPYCSAGPHYICGHLSVAATSRIQQTDVDATVLEKMISNTWDHFGDVLPTLKAISRGEWYWGANQRCKYIEIRIDTRDGGCLLFDSQRLRISPEQFAHQSHDLGKMDPWPAKNALGDTAPKPAPAPLSDDGVRDAAFEAVRKKLCALPRYSLVLDDDGLIRRVQDRVGNWIEFNEAHALFDPVSVDAARKQGVNHD